MTARSSTFMLRLKNLRLSRGLSQADLAAQIHLSATTINRYECGGREPDLCTLEAIALFFGVDFNYLLGMADVMPEQSEIDLAMLRKFHALDERGKSTVLNTLDHEFAHISTK